MSDASTVDTGATPSVASTPAAPPTVASDTQGSAPAPVDTTANGPESKGTEPDKQSRRESRAFATLRRENREMARQLGYLQAQYEAFNRQPPQTQTEREPQQEGRQAPPQPTVNRREIEATEAFRERLEDAGEDIEGFDGVMEIITSASFPGTVAMRDFLMETDKPADMAKWLADNPKEARRISLLSDAGQWRALERAEAKLAKPAPRTTQAPPPVPTVNGRSTPAFDPDKASMEEYAAHWKAKKGIKD